jgi:hypothetical protein
MEEKKSLLNKESRAEISRFARDDDQRRGFLTTFGMTEKLLTVLEINREIKIRSLWLKPSECFGLTKTHYFL